MNKLKKIFFASLLILPMLGFVRADRDIYLDIAKSIEVFGKVYREISLNYVDQILPDKFMQSGIEGMLSVLDPYSVYIDENMQKDFDIITNGKYGGIGASVGIRNGEVTILEIMDDYPAKRQGLRVGDIIKEVNQTEITKENFNELGNHINGSPGKEINLLIQREGVEDLIKFNIVLEEITIKNIDYYGFYPESSNNVYIKLSNFSRGAGQEIKSAILELNKIKKINSLVLDLRDNPGGLLDEAIDVAEKFLAKNKLIVSVAGRDTTKVVKYFAKEEPLLGETELFILVNKNSASASEIVAGAIQDHDRGVIIGENTFGKGLVQTIIPISSKSSLKLTTARYFTPSGRCIQKIDYSESKKNKKNVSLKKNGYLTDNERMVYSSGGIMPDSLVLSEDESEILDYLSAEGLIFQFVNFSVNKNKSDDFGKLNDENIYNDFTEYIKHKNFKYTSAVSKMFDKIEDKIGGNKYSSLKNEINIIREKLNSLDKDELQQNKIQIISRLKKEFAERLLNKAEKFDYLLKHDSQFNAAYSLSLNRNFLYKLLGVQKRH
jgi:carboxyl-terminal processing protease